MTTFEQLSLDARLLRALGKLGFNETTEVQQAAIPGILAGRDIMVCAKTGSGKTAAFILPMLNRFLEHESHDTATRALILLPTRELALQTQKAFQALASFTQIKCGLIMGGEAFKHQIATIRKNPEVLIATPGRLIEHIENANVELGDLEFLVLDEADRMLDMGFAEAMDKIAEVCKPERQNLLFSATLKHKGFGLISRFLKDPLRIKIDALTHGHSQITQQIVLADDDRHKENIIAALIDEEQAQRIFVFCNTRLQAQKVSNMLQAKKLSVNYIHGEVSQSDRKQVMDRFRSGSLRVLVATDVAARGLDIKDIDLVINFTVPHTGDDHVHRIGRTGRAEREGKAITLVNSIEWNRMSSIERYLKIRFSLRKVKGLEANYSGPKKLKKSGKAAGPKNKKRMKPKGSNTGGNRTIRKLVKKSMKE